MGRYAERIRRDWADASTARRFATVVVPAASVAIAFWFVRSGVFGRSDVRLAAARLLAVTGLYVLIRTVKRRR